MEEQYPSYQDIISNPLVASALQSYWQQTLSFASPSGRKEMGAWIYLNTGTGAYHVQDIPNSNVVQCGSGGGSIAPGPTIVYITLDRIPVLDDVASSEILLSEGIRDAQAKD